MPALNADFITLPQGLALGTRFAARLADDCATDSALDIIFSVSSWETPLRMSPDPLARQRESVNNPNTSQ